MTRILILGNSHAATLRRAFPAIRAAYPQVTLSFWGLPGAAFAKASTGPDGLVRPDPSDRVSQRKADQWNDREAADPAAHDHVFLVGLRFNLRQVLTLMRGLQPLHLGRRSGALGVSDSFLRAAIRAEVDASLKAQIARTPLDRRVTVMPAPYPATGVTRRGTDLFEPVTTGAALLPHASELMTLYEHEIISAHAEQGLTVALQPRDSLARPFLTDDRYLEDPDRDARHMNADYGLAAFAALLDAAPKPHPAATAAAKHA